MAACLGVFRRKDAALGLLRTIIALIILVILAHAGLSYLGYGPSDNQVVELVFQMGQLLEIPAAMLLPGRGFYTLSLIHI